MWQKCCHKSRRQNHDEEDGDYVEMASCDGVISSSEESRDFEWKDAMLVIDVIFFFIYLFGAIIAWIVIIKLPLREHTEYWL